MIDFSVTNTVKSDEKGRIKIEDIIRILHSNEGMKVDEICR